MTKNIWQTAEKPILALAPMAGYTNSAFRILCLENKADIVYTEMTSVEALWRKNKKTLKMLQFLPGEKNVILQLFGARPESFKKAVNFLNKKIARDLLPVAGYDINLGCPAKKICKTGAGAALMDNKKLAREIIQAVLENAKLPVSIKIRSQVKKVSAVEFIKFIKDLPISAVMIHGRSLEQGFSGPINFKIIKEVKKILTQTPVLANGGIYTPQDAKDILDKTNSDGIGIARGALGNPWIFQQIKNYLKRQAYQEPSWEEIKKAMRKHARLFLNYSDNLIPLRKSLIWYVKGMPNASQIKQKLIKIKSLEELKKL